MQPLGPCPRGSTWVSHFPKGSDTSGTGAMVSLISKKAHQKSRLWIRSGYSCWSSLSRGRYSLWSRHRASFMGSFRHCRLRFRILQLGNSSVDFDRLPLQTRNLLLHRMLLRHDGYRIGDGFACKQREGGRLQRGMGTRKENCRVQRGIGTRKENSEI